MPRSFCALLVTLLTFLASADAAPPPTPAEGQTWTYRTRPHEPASRLVIVHLYQPAKGERIAYVAVLGATVWFDGQPKPVAWTYCSFPLTEVVLRQSLRTLESERTEQTFPEVEKTYLGWRKNAEAGRIERWTIPADQVMDDLERRIRKSKSP